MAQLNSIGFLLIAVLAFASAKSVPSGRGFRIRGGEVANITELPHQVYIDRLGYGPYCGGSIISSRHILTQIECVDGEPDEDDYDVIAAASSLDASDGDEYYVDKITKHPDGGRNNLAVLTLNRAIEFSEKAQPITLAGPKYRIRDGAKLIASGWGYTEDSGRTNKLRKVTMTKVSDDECKNAFANINITNSFCAGGKDEKTCMYDDGGPIIEKTNKGINVLVGVTSLPTYCKTVNEKPSLFTKVSQFNKWIKKIVKEDLQWNEE